MAGPHGEFRIRKRIGINKSSVRRVKKLAFQKGLTHAETTGKLHKYITWTYLKADVRDRANNIRVFANHIWLFRQDRLITVYRLPGQYIALANKLLKHKKQEEGH